MVNRYKKIWGGEFLCYVHYSVMIEEVLQHLVRGQDRFFLDCTLGEGGHSLRILERFQQITVYGIDRDQEILNVSGNRLSKFFSRIKLFNLNFSDLSSIDEIEPNSIDSAIIDLGISIYHYKKSKRGFSFLKKERLDMRLQEEGISAYDIINSYSESDLKKIFFEYGEERFSPKIAKNIVREREIQPIEYSDELADLVKRSIPKKFHGKRIHPATKIFQALRIVVNDEFENIRKGIPAVLSKLKKGGRLGVITFHSLEDRIVKGMFNYMFKECVCPPEFPVCICDKKREISWVKKMLIASENEVLINPPSRSAKLRIVEKK